MQDEAPPYDFSGEEEENLRRRIQLIGVMYWMVAFLLLTLALWNAHVGVMRDAVPASTLAAIFITTGVGLIYFVPAARYAAFVLSIPLVFFFPIGTIIAVSSVIALHKGKMFFGQKPEAKSA